MVFEFIMKSDEDGKDVCTLELRSFSRHEKRSRKGLPDLTDAEERND